MNIKSIIKIIKDAYPKVSDIENLDENLDNAVLNEKYVNLKILIEKNKKSKIWDKIVDEIGKEFNSSNSMKEVVIERNVLTSAPSYSIFIPLSNNANDLKSIMICFSFLAPCYSMFFAHHRLLSNGKYTKHLLEYDISKTEYSHYENRIKAIIAKYCSYIYLDSAICNIKVDENLYLETYYEDDVPTIFDFLYTTYRC